MGEVAAQHLGYKGLTGPSRRILSALRQYGLLDYEGGRKRVRLSQRAITLMSYPEASLEYQEAAGAAARSPKLFGSLLSQYGDDLPSDATLRARLVADMSFSPQAAAKAVDTFRESISYAAGPDSDEREAPQSLVEEGIAPQDVSPSSEHRLQAHGVFGSLEGSRKTEPRVHHRWQLGGGVSAELILRGEPGPEHAASLRSYLEIALRILDTDVAAGIPPATETNVKLLEDD